MAATRIVATIPVLELDSAYFACTLTDEAGDAVPLASLDDITLTLYDKVADSIINSRSAVSVKNSNGGTFGATDGAFTMTFASDDNPIVSTTLATGKQEEHHALFKATWNSGAGRKSWIVRLRVTQMHRVP